MTYSARELVMEDPGKPLVTFRPNGTIELGEGVSPEVAAAVVWEAIKFEGQSLGERAASALRSLRAREGCLPIQRRSCA